MPRATRIGSGPRRSIAVADIVAGDRIALSPGARAPVDGMASGPALIDRSALTGEAAPLRLGTGDTVRAGDPVLQAPLVVTAIRRAEDSTLRKIAALANVAESARHRYSPVADRAAQIYAPLVRGLASPPAAAIAMSSSSLTVVANAVRP